MRMLASSALRKQIPILRWAHPRTEQVHASSIVMRPQAGALLEEKAALRKQVRKQLKEMSVEQRRLEDHAIQKNVLESSWFQSASSICAYVSCFKLREVCTDGIVKSLLDNNKALYVPRVLDSSSNMVMLKITSLADEHVDRSSMDIVEPKLVLPSGEPREDAMKSSSPIDLIILPGLAFDRDGGRLGRGGGYYDKFLTAYLEHARRQGWKPPLLAALAYSVQIVDEAIPMDQSDMHMDMIVTADRCHVPARQ